MPTKIDIHAHSKHYCHPCEHLKFANAFYGHDFVRGDYECLHPEADEFERPKDPEKAKLFDELVGLLGKRGRPIGKKDRQPSWCPLRKDGINDN